MNECRLDLSPRIGNLPNRNLPDAMVTRSLHPCPREFLVSIARVPSTESHFKMH